MRREQGQSPIHSVRETGDSRQTARLSVSFLISTGLHTLLIFVLGIVTMALPSWHVWTAEVTLEGPRLETPPVELKQSETRAAASTGSPDQSRFADSEQVNRSIVALVESIRGVNRAIETGTRQRILGPVDEVKAIPGPLDRDIGFRTFGDGDDLGEAQFFGIKARGNSIVYVVDSSLSMGGRKWERAIYELNRSIEALTDEQSFYVIFFDQRSRAFLGERYPSQSMRRATDENREQFVRWIRSIRLGPSTLPLESMRSALYLRPDAVFLLSDGEFQDQTVSYLHSQNRQRDEEGRIQPGIKIHTVCFESTTGQRHLKQIATDSLGTYRFVP